MGVARRRDFATAAATAAYAEPVVAKRVGCECVRRGWPRAAKFVVIGGVALARVLLVQRHAVPVYPKTAAHAPHAILRLSAAWGAHERQLVQPMQNCGLAGALRHGHSAEHLRPRHVLEIVEVELVFEA